jgi:hypothetical protein
MEQPGIKTPPHGANANVLPDPFATPRASRVFPVATPMHHSSQHANFYTQPEVGGTSLTPNPDGGYESEVSVFSTDDVHQSRAASPTPARDTTKKSGVVPRLRAKAGNPSSGKRSDGISAAQYGALKALLETALGKLAVQEERINQLQVQQERTYDFGKRNWEEFGTAWSELNGKLDSLCVKGIRSEQRSPPVGQGQRRAESGQQAKQEGGKKEVPRAQQHQERGSAQGHEARPPQQRGSAQVPPPGRTVPPPPQQVTPRLQIARRPIAAATAAKPSDGPWVTAKDKKTVKQERRQVKAAAAPAKTTPMEKRRILLVRNQSTPATTKKDADIQSAINRALFQNSVPYWIRLRDIHRNERGTITGTTTEFCTAEMLLQYRDTVIIAARTVDKGIVDVEANESWGRVKVHGVPLERYVGKGTHGLEKFKEEVQAENAGVVIPLAVRWLGSMANIKERWAAGAITSSSVTFAVKGGAVVKKLVKEGVRVCGLRYRVELYLEERPDSQCDKCARWGHIESNCPTGPAMVRCNLCAERHRTADHVSEVPSCKAGQGQLCVHVEIKCPNCKGKHLGMSRQCEAKRAAKEAARGWRSAYRGNPEVSEEEEVCAEEDVPGDMEVEPSPNSDAPVEQPTNEAQLGTPAPAPPVEEDEEMNAEL